MNSSPLLQFVGVFIVVFVVAYLTCFLLAKAELDPLLVRLVWILAAVVVLVSACHIWGIWI